MLPNWQKLSQIKELSQYFEADFVSFQQQVEHHILTLEQFDSKELDKLALLRVLEVTNGCTQWGLRRHDPHCLSVEQTRDCMRTVIGFILAKQIDLPSGDSIRFSPPIEQLMNEVRELYHAAFKKHVEGAEREYYASSAAQFLVYGRPRLESAIQVVAQEFEPLFTPYYLEQGQNYIAPYLEAILSEES